MRQEEEGCQGEDVRAQDAVLMGLKMVKDMRSVWKRTWRLMAQHLDLNKLRKMEEVIFKKMLDGGRGEDAADLEEKRSKKCETEDNLKGVTMANKATTILTTFPVSCFFLPPPSSLSLSLSPLPLFLPPPWPSPLPRHMCG